MTDRRGYVHALALLVPMLALYLWLAPPFIVDGDNAEFSTLSAEGGMAHPPGYPAYVMYLRALSWLPGSAAHSAALATALLGVAAAMVLWAACRAWGARPMAASIAVAVFAAGPIVMRLHTAAEVFAMNHLVVALVLWLAATNGPLRGARRAFVLGLVGGIGMANQHTCVLVAPLGILGAVRGVRESDRMALVTVGLSLAGLALGLAAYGYAFVAPDSLVSWGQPDSPAKLFAHFTRADYGGVGAFSPVEGKIDPVANLAALVHSLGRSWLWVLALVGIAMLGVRSVRATDGETRWAWRFLAASFLFAGPILVARFNVEPVGIGLNICQRFHLMSLLLLVIPVALGIDAIFDRARTKVATPMFDRLGVQVALAAAIFVGTAGLSLGYVRATHSPAVEQGVLNFLRSMPENAVVLTTADDMYFGSTYAQLTLGVRRDVVIVSWPMTVLPWYRERLAKRGVAIDPYANKGTEQPSIVVANQVHALKRPLFCEISLGNVLQAFPTYPYGMVFRVLPAGTPRPTLDEIVEMNHDVFSKFVLDYPFPDEEMEYAAEMHVRYARTWHIIARAFLEAGRRSDARAASDLVKQLAPTK